MTTPTFVGTARAGSKSAAIAARTAYREYQVGNGTETVRGTVVTNPDGTTVDRRGQVRTDLVPATPGSLLLSMVGDLVNSLGELRGLQTSGNVQVGKYREVAALIRDAKPDLACWVGDIVYQQCLYGEISHAAGFDGYLGHMRGRQLSNFGNHEATGCLDSGEPVVLRSLNTITAYQASPAVTGTKEITVPTADLAQGVRPKYYKVGKYLGINPQTAKDAVTTNPDGSTTTTKVYTDDPENTSGQAGVRIDAIRDNGDGTTTIISNHALGVTSKDFPGATWPVGTPIYVVSEGEGYAEYFGSEAGPFTVGTPTLQSRSYYAVNLGIGNWRLISLGDKVSWAQGSDLATWLEKELSRNTHTDLLVSYHQPRFTDGSTGAVQDRPTSDYVWTLLDAARFPTTIPGTTTPHPRAGQRRVRLIVSGHDHNYQRTHPITTETVTLATGRVDGNVDTGGGVLRKAQPVAVPKGMVSIVVGSGGYGLFGIVASNLRRYTTIPIALDAARFPNLYGSLFVRLYPNGEWGWMFQAITAGYPVLDEGRYSATQELIASRTINPTTLQEVTQI